MCSISGFSVLFVFGGHGPAIANYTITFAFGLTFMVSMNMHTFMLVKSIGKPQGKEGVAE